MRMNPLKCAFGVTAGKFLGFLVHRHGIKADEDKVKSIRAMPPPHSQKELKKFLGKVSYIRRFIPVLVEIFAPFGSLLKGDAKFEWNQEHQKVFERIKAALISPQTMIAPQPGVPLMLYLTSTPKSIGALLVQDVDGAECPVKPALIGKVARWLLALGEFKITCVAPKAIKNQALADLLAQFPSGDYEPVNEELRGEVHAAMVSEESFWTLSFDGAAARGKGGTGIVLTSKNGEKLYLSYKLDFHCSINEVEYEALILGLIAAEKHSIKKIRIRGGLKVDSEKVEIEHVPRSNNKFSDALATLGARVNILEEEATIVIKKRTEPSIIPEDKDLPEDWKGEVLEQLRSKVGKLTRAKLAQFIIIQVYIDYLKEGTLLESPRDIAHLKRRARRYFLDQNKLYRRSIEGIAPRYVPSRDEVPDLSETQKFDPCSSRRPAQHPNAMAVPYLGFRSDRAHLHTFKGVQVDSCSYGIEHKVGRSNPSEERYGACSRELHQGKYHLPVRSTEYHTLGQWHTFLNKYMKSLLETYQVKHHKSTPYYRKGNGQAEATNKTLIRILSKMIDEFGGIWAYHNLKRKPTQATPYSLVYGSEAVLPIELETPSARMALTSGMVLEPRTTRLEALEEKHDRAAKVMERYHESIA
ncbi:uncharacterized protein LOC114311403 [Camellia sinensis]|uniref:uncharacterized protein LOC114311403 n=1 Tax=Camellia sinensis TaxID=4442 RepID=UPI001035E0B0|nr:uncharacterized protein LOC114311403 [Camellia sinensis]